MILISTVKEYKFPRVYIKEHITEIMTDEQTRQNILRLLRSTHREGIEGVIDYLCKSDFFRVRCHSHHHMAGGLA